MTNPARRRCAGTLTTGQPCPTLLRRGKGAYARYCDACDQRMRDTDYEALLAAGPPVNTEDPDEWYDWGGTTPRVMPSPEREAKLRQQRDYDLCACGQEKKKISKRCRACAAAARSTPGKRTSNYCQCGSRKRPHAAMCRACRYPNSEWAQLRRQNERIQAERAA